MMTESWRTVDDNGCSSVPRNTSTKRSFDVAFLTGNEEIKSSREKLNDDTDSKYLTDSTEPSCPSTPEVASPSSDDELNKRTGDFPSSAFTKVLGSQIPLHMPGSSNLGMPRAIQSPWIQKDEYLHMNNFYNNAKSLSPFLSRSLIPSVYGSLLSPPSPEKLRSNIIEQYLKSQYPPAPPKLNTVNDTVATSETLNRLRSSVISASEAYKLPFPSFPYSLGAPPNKFPLPFPSSAPAPPIVPPSLSQINLHPQNVCAKCNISFRMTSDLVYHMRSQHRKEEDPTKKRRNEKLKCPICSESFRERHHLTRHMTAHQDRNEEKNETKENKAA